MFLTATEVRSVSLPQKFGDRPFWTEGRLAALTGLLGPLTDHAPVRRNRAINARAVGGTAFGVGSGVTYSDVTDFPGTVATARRATKTTSGTQRIFDILAGSSMIHDGRSIHFSARVRLSEAMTLTVTARADTRTGSGGTAAVRTIGSAALPAGVSTLDFTAATLAAGGTVDPTYAGFVITAAGSVGSTVDVTAILDEDAATSGPYFDGSYSPTAGWIATWAENPRSSPSILTPPGAGSSGCSIPRMRTEWNNVMGAPADYTPIGPISPFVIPETYQDAGGEERARLIVDGDTNTAVDLALRWLVLGDAAAGAACVRILTAWSTLTAWTLDGGATTTLYWVSRAPKLIQAAMMVSDHPDYTPTVSADLKAMLARSVAAGASPAYSDSYENNAVVRGLIFELAMAVFVGDRPQFDRAIVRWREMFDANIVDNVPVLAVFREGSAQGDGSTGLWYSNSVVYAHTVAAEWARFGGEWLYDHVAPDGSTLKGLALRVRRWTRYPQLFPYNTSGTPLRTIRSLPHDEILHALWPDEDSAWIVNAFPSSSDRDAFGVRGAALIYRNRPLYG